MIRSQVSVLPVATVIVSCVVMVILTVKLLATLSGLRRITVTSPTLCTCVVSVEGKMNIESTSLPREEQDTAQCTSSCIQ